MSAEKKSPKTSKAKKPATRKPTTKKPAAKKPVAPKSRPARSRTKPQEPVRTQPPKVIVFDEQEVSDLAMAIGGVSDEVEELRRVNQRLNRSLIKAKAKTADLVEAVYIAARDAAMTQGRPMTVPRPPASRRKGSPEDALIHATDWQYGKHTDTYSMGSCEERIMLFSDKIAKLTEIQRAAHPVNEAHILFGGDMVEGTTIFPGQVFEIESTLYDQLFGVAKLMEDFIRRQLSIFQVVHVWEEYGNHGRLGRKGEQPAGDNIDRMAYRIVRERFADEKRVVWHPVESWHNMVEIGNYRALLVHGDEIKSFGGNTPAFGILRKCNAWATGVVDEFHDVYMGHFHTPMSLTMANGGRIFVSGSPESDNQYAAEFVAARGRPSQRLHFIDPDAGSVTAEYTIWLD